MIILRYPPLKFILLQVLMWSGRRRPLPWFLLIYLLYAMRSLYNFLVELGRIDILRIQTDWTSTSIAMIKEIHIRHINYLPNFFKFRWDAMSFVINFGEVLFHVFGTRRANISFQQHHFDWFLPWYQIPPYQFIRLYFFSKMLFFIWWFHYNKL